MSGISRNLMGPNPRGVPSPRVVHVHPYPTRYHGTINTRPMFNLPFQYQPHAVFKPDDFNREPPPPNVGTQGLGTLQYNTGRGIFLPPGGSGGIFNSNLAGLGYTADSLPWSTYSADTVEFQKDLNNLLRAEGKPTLLEDGRMGKDTCNACRSLEACKPVPTNCAKQYTTASSSTVAPPITVTESTMLPRPGMSSSTKNALIFMGAAAAALGVGYVVMKRRKAA